MVGPGHLHWIILVLTHPCFLKSFHFWAHLPSFHAPARGSLMWPASSVCRSSQPAPHRSSCAPSGWESSSQGSSLQRTDGSQWIESLLSHRDVHLLTVAVQFPSGMELQVPSSAYHQCPTQVPWKDQSIKTSPSSPTYCS